MRLTAFRPVVAALVVLVILLGSADARAGFTITEVTPKFQWNNERLPLVVTKLAFCVEGFFPTDEIEVALIRAGEADIVGSNLDFGLGELFAEFDLTAVRAGWWDAIIDHPILGTFTLVDAFFVKDAPEFKRLSAWGGPVKAVEVQGNLAYVARGSGLVILNISDPANMVELGSVDLLCSGVTDLAMKGHYAFVPCQDPDVGLSIIDVSDPANPVTIATGIAPHLSGEEACGNHPFAIWDIQITGDTAYLFHDSNDQGSSHDWWALDVSDPESLDAETAPFRIICCAFGGVCSNTRFTIGEAGQYLYMIENFIEEPDTWQLRLFDISLDPFSPVLVSITNLFFTSSEFLPSAVAVEGDLLVVSAYHGGAPVESRLTLVDVSNPLQPFVNGVYQDGGGPFDPGIIQQAYDVALRDGLAYVADTGNQTTNIPDGRGHGLHILDVGTDPAEPVLLATYITRGPVWRVTTDGSTAYLSDRGEGVVAIDVSNPADPVRMGNWHSPGVIQAIEVVGDTLVISDFWNGITTLDVSDPREPVLQDVYQPTGVGPSGGGVNGIVDVEDGYAFLATRYNGLNVVDISNPEDIALAALYPYDHLSSLAAVAPLAVKDDILLTTTFFDGSWAITVFDVADPLNPIIATPTLNSPAQETYAISDGLLAVSWAAGGWGQTIHDISDPYAPVVLEAWGENTQGGCFSENPWFDRIVLDGTKIYGIYYGDPSYGVRVHGELGIDPLISLLACLDIHQAWGLDIAEGIAYVSGKQIDGEDPLGPTHGDLTLHALDLSQIDDFNSAYDPSGPIIGSGAGPIRHLFNLTADPPFLYASGDYAFNRWTYSSVVTYRVAAPGSSSIDGDLDLADFADFQNCFSGAGAPPAQPECLIHDFDDDGDVDHADYAAWREAMTGAF